MCALFHSPRRYCRPCTGRGGAVVSAVISDCGTYRYLLERGGDGQRVTFVMLNPSTADAEQDDPTIRRCLGYAKAWGYGRLAVVNLYAYRATKPADLWDACDWGGIDIIGPKNDTYIEDVCSESSMVVCAWGNHGAGRGRAGSVMRRLRDIGVKPHALKISKIGEPCHPLYLRSDLKPETIKAARKEEAR